MEWNGLIGLIYGLLGGISEFLPVSPDAHNSIILKLLGLEQPGYGMSLAVHIGCLAAVILSCYPRLSKLFQERGILRQPKRIRKRQPDVVSLMEFRLLTIAAVPVSISCLFTPWLHQYFSRLWVLILIVMINGVVVLVPHYMSRANKDARSMSPLDAMLMGLSGVFGTIPGLSRIAAINAVASMRGTDRQFALEFTYLLSIPALIVLCLVDVYMMIAAGYPQAGAMLLPGILACAAAFGAALAGVKLMRFLAVKVGYESLAYYNYGLAMFTFVIYLIG